ncbi:hypothetical protein TrST_g7284 [Triparma strigata]|uniref:YHYH domain-containing protein n=1 Tax=Triparma strigata TaxID=1606541 RepID=A0A9W7AJ50_9STRA|nr:hypothetical protein TrST_g7284 [Triparma strigata]
MKFTFLISTALYTAASAQHLASSYAHYAKELHASASRLEFDRALKEAHLGGRGLQGPPGPSNSGSVPSSDCDTTDGDVCANDGSSNYVDRTNLSYDLTTGKFSGSMVTNECNDQLRQYGFSSASCEEQTVPAPSVTSTPSGTPLLGRIAMTLSGGVNIYSAFEAGFNDCDVDGQPCACSGASCPGGMDVKTCEEHLYHACTSDVVYQMFMDSCGGHATPYHIHTDPICNYESSDNGHSTLVGVSMDGYGIYGKFETDQQRPCDLDVCHGHVGFVPVQEEHGVTKSVEVYHYHVQDSDVYPYTWTLGCYGDPKTPIDLETCKSLYDDCDDDLYTVETGDGTFEVDLYCPCFEVVQEGCDSQTATM